MTDVLCLAPSPSVDVTYVLDRLQVAGVNRPARVVRVPGGKGLNAARSAATWGANVRAVAPLGGATGEWIAERMANHAVALDRIMVSSETRTCVSLAETGSSTVTMTEVYENSSPLSVGDVERFIDAAQKDSRNCSWATLSGSIPMPADVVPEFVSRACALQPALAVDLAGAALAAAVENRPALVKVNRSEASGLLGGDLSAVAAAREIHERCGAISVVSDGVDGVVCVSDDGTLRVRSAERGSFPVGSGDTLLGVLVAQLATGSAVDEALVAATAASVANALVPGAAVWERSEAERVRRAVSVGTV